MIHCMFAITNLLAAEMNFPASCGHFLPAVLKRLYGNGPSQTGYGHRMLAILRRMPALVYFITAELCCKQVIAHCIFARRYSMFAKE